MRLNRKRLVRETNPLGFSVIEPDFLKDGLSLYRRSSFSPLYEHVVVGLKSAVKASLFISASPHPCWFSAITCSDKEFKAFMSPDVWYHQTTISNRKEATAWENRFVEHLDEFSTRTANTLGPGLFAQVEPVLHDVKGYLDCVGDLFLVFDREFGFLSEIPLSDQQLVSKIAWQAQIMYRSCENANLACHLLVRYADQFGENRDELVDQKLFRNARIGARIHLLTDAIAEKRREYQALGGLFRKEIC